MTIIGRLAFLEIDMKLVIERLETGRADSLEAATREFRERIRDRFKGLSLVTGNGGIVAAEGSPSPFPELSRDERKHLNEGKTLVTVGRSKWPYPGVFMVRAVDPARSDRRILFGEIQPSYLWGGEAFALPETEFVIFDKSDKALFSSFSEYIPSREVAGAIRLVPASRNFSWTYKRETYLASYWTMFMVPPYSAKWVLVLSQPRTDILKPIHTFEQIFLLVIALTFVVVFFLSFGQIRKSLIPIELLQEGTRRIAARDFEARVEIKSNDEFEELGRSFNEMADSIKNHLMIMTKLNDVGIALSAEKDTNHLLKLITISAKSVTRADACSLYIISESKELKLAVRYIDSLGLFPGGDEPIPLFDVSGKPNHSIVAASSVLSEKTINIRNLYSEEGVGFSGNFDSDRKIGYESRSILSVPMRNHENEIIGVLQLANASDGRSQEIIPFSDRDQRLAETLSSQAAIALTKNALIDGLKKLFDSLVELIAAAVDDKSPYTGGHCRRVPELSMMLAKAVCDSKNGAFGNFRMSDEEFYELKIAALLHDCGKVSTPTHIADKATRLEGIYDRIDLIDARFEILERDLKISSLCRKLRSVKGMAEWDASESAVDMLMEQIEKDRTFVRACNKHEEHLGEEHRDRLREIAKKYRWVNAMNEEESVIPEGELSMLVDAVGTLTPEERLILDRHVVTTVKMLEKLPYPKSLRNVPIFAGVHHEYMDGSGYPKGLMKEQIPLQGRIIAIADIFEALTANDRPYRKAYTLTEALSILESMKEEGRIDADLFDLFMSAGVYQKYADAYLTPEQINNTSRYVT
ncbi:MAG TPA: HD domain-containing phosphohydrolase [Thermodesulfovibrionales bacterium]|nr:HD domain-containing phosphohydrolase [Thermodesulfovibrionales bacterium]